MDLLVQSDIVEKTRQYLSLTLLLQTSAYFYPPSVQQWWRAILIQQVCPSVCLSRYSIVSKRLNISSYFLEYGSPMILVFPVPLVNIFAKFWRVPLQGHLIQVGYINFAIPPRPLPKVSEVFPPRQKLTHTDVYASGNGRHHRCPVRFTPPPENLLFYCLCAAHARSLCDC